MKQRFFLLLLSLSLSTLSMAQKEQADVIITTDSGKIYLRLFDETPKHKENFLKLASEGFYDGVAFHRIIKSFMIQTGNPSFRNPNPSKEDGPGYMLDAEIVPKYVHTRGMLAAARLGDQMNPERKSSGSQFYIVTGRSVSDAELTQNEQSITMALQNKEISAKMPELQKAFLAIPENQAAFAEFQALNAAKDPKTQEVGMALDKKFQDYIAKSMPASTPFKYTEEQRKAYNQKGGAPHLDMQYTVFGEVLEGMDVVAKLEKVQTAAGDKPVNDIRMMKVEVVKKK